MLDIGLYLVYALLFISIAACIVFPIIQAAKEPSTFGKSAIGIGALVVLFGISYAFAGSHVSAKAAALGTSATASKLIGAGLIMFYLSLVLAVLALAYSEISKALK